MRYLMYEEKTFMNIRKLDHVSFLVKDVERSRRFYGQVLGLREIPRPSNASNSGAWLTNEKHSFEVHLIGEAEDGRVAQTHRSEEHTSELQSPDHLVCRLLLEKKKNIR